jgi:hypothetical protein
MILRELDRTGLGGTLRGQLRTTLNAARTYGEKPLGHAVPVDFQAQARVIEFFRERLGLAEGRY